MYRSCYCLGLRHTVTAMFNLHILLHGFEAEIPQQYSWSIKTVGDNSLTYVVVHSKSLLKKVSSHWLQLLLGHCYELYQSRTESRYMVFRWDFGHLGEQIREEVRYT